MQTLKTFNSNRYSHRTRKMQIVMSFYEQQNEIQRNSLFTHSYGEEKRYWEGGTVRSFWYCTLCRLGLHYTVLTSILWGVVKALIELTSNWMPVRRKAVRAENVQYLKTKKVKGRRWYKTALEDNTLIFLIIFNKQMKMVSHFLDRASWYTSVIKKQQDSLFLINLFQ